MSDNVLPMKAVRGKCCISGLEVIELEGADVRVTFSGDKEKDTIMYVENKITGEKSWATLNKCTILDFLTINNEQLKDNGVYL